MVIFVYCICDFPNCKVKLHCYFFLNNSFKSCFILPWGGGVYRNHNFFVVWHWLTIFGTWLHHHETMCRAHSWSLYDLKVTCCGRWRLTSRFLTRCRVWPMTIFYLTFSYHIWHMCKSVPYFHDPLYDLWPQYQNCIYTMNLSLARLSFALWHLSIPNLA